jgi:hypothetical protein
VWAFFGATASDPGISAIDRGIELSLRYMKRLVDRAVAASKPDQRQPCTMHP